MACLLTCPWFLVCLWIRGPARARGNREMKTYGPAARCKTMRLCTINELCPSLDLKRKITQNNVHTYPYIITCTLFSSSMCILTYMHTYIQMPKCVERMQEEVNNAHACVHACMHTYRALRIKVHMCVKHTNIHTRAVLEDQAHVWVPHYICT